MQMNDNTILICGSGSPTSGLGESPAQFQSLGLVLKRGLKWRLGDAAGVVRGGRSGLAASTSSASAGLKPADWNAAIASSPRWSSTM
jgi:hypothetical protein